MSIQVFTIPKACDLCEARPATLQLDDEGEHLWLCISCVQFSMDELRQAIQENTTAREETQ